MCVYVCMYVCMYVRTYVCMYVTNGCRHFSFCFCFGKVWIHEGLSDIEDDYELCVTIPAVTGIPSAGYFGVSAATGGLSGGGNLGGGGGEVPINDYDITLLLLLPHFPHNQRSDDHDVLKFITHSLILYENRVEVGVRVCVCVCVWSMYAVYMYGVYV